MSASRFMQNTKITPNQVKIQISFCMRNGNPLKTRNEISEAIENLVDSIN